MFLHLVNYTRKGIQGCYCSLMESYRDASGKPRHKRVASLGFFPSERIPFLKAAFSKEDPYEVLRRETSQETDMGSVDRGETVK